MYGPMPWRPRTPRFSARSARSAERCGRGRAAVLRRESGFSLIEVLVAAVLLAVGLLAVFRGLSVGQRGTTAAERTALLTSAAEQALQSIEALPYANVADTAAPTKTSSTNTNDPTYYLSTCGARTCYQWDPSNAGSAEPIDTTNGQVNPGPTTGVVAAPNTSGCSSSSTSACRITYSLYQFVTDTTDPLCAQRGTGCASPTSYKRVTIAVVNTSRGPPSTPIYVSTFVRNKIGGVANPLTASTTTCLDDAVRVQCTH